MKYFLIFLVLLIYGCSTLEFTFIQINDLHIKDSMYVADKATYKNANIKAKLFVEEANNIKPDFVVAVGDIIHGEDEESIMPDMVLAENILDKLECHYYPVAGNHEVIQQWKFEYYFTKVFDRATNYSFHKEDVVFIVFNNGNEIIDREWLRQEIEKHKEHPIILVCHIPVILVRDEEILNKSFGFQSYVDRETFDYIKGTNVQVVLSGHLHLTGVAERDGITQIVCSGTANLPTDYFVYRVYSDRIEAEAFPLTTNIQSKSLHNRSGTDYTDSKHLTHEDYIGGNPEERKFTIPIRRITND